MTDLAELRQRVKSVGARFGDTAEEDRKRSQRLSSLLSVVEESFARSQREIQRLHEELARAKEEKQQIQNRTKSGDSTGPVHRRLGSLCNKDRNTLHKIIKRVSLQTGTLGEEQEQANTSPDPDAAPEENKKAKDRAASVRRHVMISDTEFTAPPRFSSASTAKRPPLEAARRANAKSEKGDKAPGGRDSAVFRILSRALIRCRWEPSSGPAPCT